MTAKTPLVKAVATALVQRPGWTALKFHDTEVIGFNEEMITLNSGGWQTVTTKRRMNQAADLYDLGIAVVQRHHDWWVHLRDRSGAFFPLEEDCPLAFYDGITISRDRSQPHPLEVQQEGERDYNGWPNKATWNCMLWLNNELAYYASYTAQAKREAFTPSSARNFVMRLFGYRSMFFARTPDGEPLLRVYWPRIAEAMNEGNN